MIVSAFDLTSGQKLSFVKKAGQDMLAQDLPIHPFAIVFFVEAYI